MVSLLPLAVLYLVSEFLFFVLYRVFRYRRAVVIRNLTASFPGKKPSDIKAIEKNYYHYLADLIVESIKIISISEKEASLRYLLNNPDLLDFYHRQGRSILLVAGHFGNWEMAGILGKKTDYKCLVVYKPLTNPVFERFLKKVRSKFGVEMVPMKQISRKLVMERGTPTLTVLLSDQTPAAGEIAAWTRFLNQDTAVFMGVEKLAAMTRSVVLFAHVDRPKRGYYSCTFELVHEAPETLSKFELTSMHMRLLASAIDEKPYLWLWSHKRWKHQPAGMEGVEAFD